MSEKILFSQLVFYDSLHINRLQAIGTNTRLCDQKISPSRAELIIDFHKEKSN